MLVHGGQNRPTARGKTDWRKGRFEPLTHGQRVLVTLMGLGFFAFGTAFLFFIVKDCLYGAWRTRGQVTVPATLRSVEVSQSRRRPTLDVLYDYQVDGRSYSNIRISLFRESMPFRARLFDAQRFGKTIPVFIDPRHPEFSVIDRSFSPWPILVAIPFSLAFALVGGFLLTATFRAPVARPPQ